MHLTISRSHRTIRDSIKREYVRVPKYNSISSSDSDCSSIVDDKSNETNSSEFPKLSKRQKLRSLFSHSKSKDKSFSSDSSNSTNEDIASIQSISSQSQKLSKREKVRSFFSQTKSKQATFSSDASNTTNEDVASIQSISSQSQKLSKREKLRNFMTHCKPKKDSFSSDASNATNEDVASIQSLSSQSQKLSKREKFKSYFKHSSPQQYSSSDSSTIVEKEVTSNEESSSKEQTSSRTQKIKSLLGFKQPTSNVFPGLVPIEVELKDFPELLEHIYERRAIQAKVDRRNEKDITFLWGLLSLASSSAAAFTVASSTAMVPIILPIAIPVAVVSSGIMLYKWFKLSRKRLENLKEKILDAKCDADIEFCRMKSSIRRLFPKRPYQIVAPEPKRKVLRKPENSIHAQSKPVDSVEECGSIREADYTFEYSADDNAYSLYSRTIHSQYVRPSATIFDLFGTERQMARKSLHVRFANPIASVRMYMPSVLIC